MMRRVVHGATEGLPVPTTERRERTGHHIGAFADGGFSAGWCCNHAMAVPEITTAATVTPVEIHCQVLDDNAVCDAVNGVYAVHPN